MKGRVTGFILPLKVTVKWDGIYCRVVLNKVYGIPLDMPDMPVTNIDMPDKDLEVQIGKGRNWN